MIVKVFDEYGRLKLKYDTDHVKQCLCPGVDEMPGIAQSLQEVLDFLQTTEPELPLLAPTAQQLNGVSGAARSEAGSS